MRDYTVWPVPLKGIPTCPFSCATRNIPTWSQRVPVCPRIRPRRSASAALSRHNGGLIPFPATDIPFMRLLLRYLRGYWSLVVFALVLAAINQIFSLLDPLIFRHIIDDYATKYKEYTNAQFFRGVVGLLGMAVGVAFVSRVAKNFQELFARTLANCSL
jgi:hypothetical protein